MRMVKCVMVLSTKSAGSSALQRLLCAGAGARHIEYSRHAEHETLYWTKAASILGLHQLKLSDSEVPLPRSKARHDLLELLRRNVPEFVRPEDPKALIFGGWRALCMHYSPIFVEKSPHYIHQWACLQLIAEAARQSPDIDFRFVGLIRNPMDTIYSVWDRWRVLPDEYQFHWLTAYRNLLRFRELTGRRLCIVRYESLAGGAGAAEKLFKDLDIDAGGEIAADHSIDDRSVSKWRRDPGFGFRLDPRVAACARQLGYADHELANALDVPRIRCTSRPAQRADWPVCCAEPPPGPALSQPEPPAAVARQAACACSYRNLATVRSTEQR
jgi:hypothetical protein